MIDAPDRCRQNCLTKDNVAVGFDLDPRYVTFNTRIRRFAVYGDQLVKELLPLVCYGKLKRIEYRIELPNKEHGEWKLLMKEVESSLENMKSSFEFVESTAKGQQ